MQEIVIVDDEPAIADTLAFALGQERFATRCFALGGAALAYLATHPAALVVLDVGLPDMSGLDVCRELRRFSTVPVLFLSARGAEVDRILGLELGGDDYVVKPFSPREVVARIRTILRRAVPSPVAPASAGPFTVNEAERRITYRGQTLKLTRHEFALLHCLLSQPRRVFSREQLLDAAGVASGAGYERSIDTHIKSLRTRLRDVAPEHDPIQTHHGVGYSIDPEQA